MGMGVDPTLDEGIHEIAALIAVAYGWRARVRQVGPATAPLPSTEDLDNTGELTEGVFDMGVVEGAM